MDRRIFRDEHHAFREVVRRFLAERVAPRQEAWAEAGCVDRDAWREAGEVGLLCPWLPPEHGGPGGDFLMSVVVMEELARIYESGFAIPLHSDIVVPYLASFGDDAQKARWLPGCASGELVTAIAMTEPGTGSDLASIATTAVRDGDHYVVNGSKTFISNGLLADLVVVAVRTGGHPDPHQQLSLVVVEAGTPGFQRGRKLRKMGMASQDTTELHFVDCRVPVANRLGAEGMGFLMLMQKLQQERLVVAVAAQATAEQVLQDCLRYVKERQAFGKPIGTFQNTRFALADAAAKVEVGRAFLDRLVEEHVAGTRLVKECSMAKLWQTEMLGEVVDTCLQFYGGYGYMLEYPISRAYMDARVQRIYAGTNEVMKIIVAKELGL
jgi:acyl-CoA dehydrogenase